MSDPPRRSMSGHGVSDPTNPTGSSCHNRANSLWYTSMLILDFSAPFLFCYLTAEQKRVNRRDLADINMDAQDCRSLLSTILTHEDKPMFSIWEQTHLSFSSSSDNVKPNTSLPRRTFQNLCQSFGVDLWDLRVPPTLHTYLQNTRPTLVQPLIL